MVVKKVIISIVAICWSFNAFAGYNTIACYRISMAKRVQIESGIEQWLKQNPKYLNHDGWEKILEKPLPPPYIRDTIRTNKYLKELQNNNYSIDFWGYKGYIVYDPQSSIYYSIMVLNWMGFYMAGLDVCVMNICHSDGRCEGLKELSDNEIKEALKKFKKNIFTQIVEYVRKEQKKK